MWETAKARIGGLFHFQPLGLPVSFAFLFSLSCAVVWAGKPSWSQLDANETIAGASSLRRQLNLQRNPALCASSIPLTFLEEQAFLGRHLLCQYFINSPFWLEIQTVSLPAGWNPQIQQALGQGPGVLYFIKAWSDSYQADYRLTVLFNR